jgi:hypothetical protein
MTNSFRYICPKNRNSDSGRDISSEKLAVPASIEPEKHFCVPRTDLYRLLLTGGLGEVNTDRKVGEYLLLLDLDYASHNGIHQFFITRANWLAEYRAGGACGWATV